MCNVWLGGAHALGNLDDRVGSAARAAGENPPRPWVVKAADPDVASASRFFESFAMEAKNGAVLIHFVERVEDVSSQEDQPAGRAAIWNFETHSTLRRLTIDSVEP